MAKDSRFPQLQNDILKSIFGKQVGLDPAGILVGPAGFRDLVEGMSGAGTTITSTSVASNLSAGGVSLVGASGASGTTAYNLAAPQPGMRKVLFNPTTGNAVIGTTGAGAFICSTASITSTQGIITLSGKGSNCELVGLTTNLWGVLNPVAGIASASTNITFG